MTKLTQAQELAQLKAEYATLKDAVKAKRALAKGSLEVDMFKVSKSNGVVLKFIGSRFPSTLWPLQIRQIVKHYDLIEEFIAENNLD